MDHQTCGIETHLQAIVDIRRGCVTGYEALSRFEDGRTPLAAFAQARLEGGGADLEAVALRSALRTREDLPHGAYLSVNVGPDVLDTPQIRQVLAEHDSLSGVVFELTEQVKIESYEHLQPMLAWLRKRGAWIAVDDTGAGYAGLQHLVGLQPEMVKLDSSLVRGLPTDPTKRALVEAVLIFCDHIGARLVVEGIETDSELDTILELDVPFAQGYLFARPARPREAQTTDLPSSVTTRLAANTNGGGTAGASIRPLLEAPGWLGERPAEATTSSEFAPPLEQSLTPDDFAVVIDTDGHPTATIDASGAQPLTDQDYLELGPNTTAAKAARRALRRRPGSRLQPLVCTDNSGRFQGIIRMEKLIEALTRHRHNK